VTAVTDNVLNTLGLARRAGALAVGEEPVAEACRTKKARVLLVAADAAENTGDKAGRLAGLCAAPVAVLPYDKAQVGFALGRSSCALLAVTDMGLAASLVGKLAAAQPERYGQTAAALEEQARRFQRRKRAKALEKRQSKAGRKSAAQPEKSANRGNRRWPV
jgi:ribosomal protein L7Ae-like RNA K-turn-binding protein